MANDIKQVTNVNGGKFNLGDIEKAAIRGVEQGKNAIELLYGGVQRETGDEAFTIKEDINFLIFAGNVTSSRVITLPVARAGRHIKLFWEVEQAGNDRVLTCAGSDTIGGNIFTSVAGNAAGNGDVVAVALSSTAITFVDDVNIGSEADLYCGADGQWLISAHLVVDAVGSVPTVA